MPAGTIFLSGGTGFVGSSVIEELLARDYVINALVRHDADNHGGKVRNFRGDLFDANVLAAGLAGCDAVIHLVGIIMENPAKGVTFKRIHHEGTKAMVNAAKAAGVKRYVQMSALGARPNAVSEYHKSKWKAEEYVRASGLDWTILRPSMIHGPQGEFMQMETAWVKKRAMPFLFMPYFGAGLFGFDGTGQLQPVYVGDVAQTFVDAVEKPQTIGKAYDLGGPDRMDWPTMHRTVAKVLTGRRRLTLPIPAWYAKLLTTIVPSSLLPFNKAQVQMAGEDNVCDLKPFIDDFGWEPQGFEATLRAYKDQL